MLSLLRRMTGTSLAIGVINVSFLLAAGTACWRSWQSGQDSVSAAPRESTESPPVPEAVSVTFSLEPNPTKVSDSRRVPTGNWLRVSSPAKITLQFDRETVAGMYQMDGENGNLQVSFYGDYQVGSDNLLYGVIQEAGVRASQGWWPEDRSPRDASRLIDQPFSARFVVHERGLTIQDVKFAGLGLRELERPLEQAFSHFIGDYSRMNTL